MTMKLREILNNIIDIRLNEGSEIFKSFKHNQKEIKFEITSDAISVYIEDFFVGDFVFDLEEYGMGCEGHLFIFPESIDLGEYIGQGFYSIIIDFLIEYETGKEIAKFFRDQEDIIISSITFQSIQRTEPATKFWKKRGYEVEFDKEEHERGEQEKIEIEIY